MDCLEEFLERNKSGSGDSSVVFIYMDIAEVFLAAGLYSAGIALLFTDHMEAVKMNLDVVAAYILTELHSILGDV